MAKSNSTQAQDPVGASPYTDERFAELRLFDSLPFLLRQTHRQFVRSLETALEPYRISPTLWYFLRVLWEVEGLTQAELSARVGQMTPAAVSALNSLERMGLVERRSDPDDKRKYRIFLTKKGRDLKGELIPVARSVHADLLKGISPLKVEVAREVLRAILKNEPE